MENTITKKQIKPISESTINNVIAFYNEVSKKLDYNDNDLSKVGIYNLFRKHKVPFSTFKAIIKLGFITKLGVSNYNCNLQTLNKQQALKVVRLRNHLAALRIEKRKNEVKEAKKIIENQTKSTNKKEKLVRKNRKPKKVSLFRKIINFLFRK
jgi:hypothetical protein